MTPHVSVEASNPKTTKTSFRIKLTIPDQPLEKTSIISDTNDSHVSVEASNPKNNQNLILDQVDNVPDQPLEKTSIISDTNDSHVSVEASIQKQPKPHFGSS